MATVKEILQNVQKLEIKTRLASEGYLSGQYHSIFKGRGIEFSEVREYVPGDDIRSIDWNVTARYDTVYVKEFIEERDLHVIIALDVSASGNFGSDKSKKQLATELAASIMYATVQNNDNLGLCLFTNSVERYIPFRKGRRHMLCMIREMLYYEPKNRTTDLNDALTFLRKVLKRRAIIFLLSDFISPPFEKALSRLRARHDIIMVQITDRFEREMPDDGYLYLEDEETGEQYLVNTNDENFRSNFSAKKGEEEIELSNLAKRLHIDHINVDSQKPAHVALRAMFYRREKRVR